jgi:lipopolysaccharide biosynthesis glycosyltransferase
MKSIDVCFALDNKYVVPCIVAIQSLCLSNCASSIVNIYILGGGITDKNKHQIESVVACHENATVYFVNVDDDGFKDFSNDTWGTAAAYRLRIGELLPHLDRILYLDSDIIVCKSVCELFSLDLGNNVIGMVPDIWCNKQRRRFPSKRQTYFNSGVCLIDLKKWRNLSISDELFNYYSRNLDKCLYPDQDSINNVLDGRILQLDCRYNFSYHWDKNECMESFGFCHVTEAVIVHFIFNKPWWSSCIHPYAYLYRDVAKTLPDFFKPQIRIVDYKLIDTVKIYICGIPFLKIFNYFSVKDCRLFGKIPLLKMKKKPGGVSEYLLFNIIPVVRMKSAQDSNSSDVNLVKNSIRYSSDYRV